MQCTAIFEHDGQRIRLFRAGHAYLDFDYGMTERWSDEKMTDVPALDYRKATRFDFCLGSDTPGSSVGVNEHGIITGDGRDAGQMIFGFRPPKPNAEILAFYNARRV